MVLLKLGLLYSIFCICSAFYNFKHLAIFFYTSWTMYLKFATFLSFVFLNKNPELKRKLLISSWTAGWVVTIMFWGYVYPLADKEKIPPLYHIASTHGGVHIFIVWTFLKSSINVRLDDVLWPIGFSMVYLFGVTVPLKFAGITIYPLFFEEFWPTIVILVVNFGLHFLVFWIGMKIKTKSNIN